MRGGDVGEGGGGGGKREKERERNRDEAWTSWSKFSGPTAFNKVSLAVEYNILVLTYLIE